MAGEGVWAALVASNPQAFPQAAGEPPAGPVETPQEPPTEPAVAPTEEAVAPVVPVIAAPDSQPPEDSIEAFINEEGKVDWKGLEAKEWYNALTPEAQQSLKGTISQVRQIIATKSSVKINDAITEARALKAQAEAQERHIKTLTEALQKTLQGPPQPVAPPAPEPLPKVLQEMVDSGYYTEEQARAMAGADPARVKADVLRELAPILQTVEVLQNRLAAEEFYKEAEKNWPKDADHPLSPREIEREISVLAQTVPWINEAGKALGASGAPPLELVEFGNTCLRRFKPELYAKAPTPAAPPQPPPKTPAPGKTGAVPIQGAAPNVTPQKPDMATLADAFVKKVKTVS